MQTSLKGGIMSSNFFTRREAMGMALGVSLVGLGCDKDKVENAAGDAIIAIGGLAILVKHPYALIVGATLVLAGSALKIYLATKDSDKGVVEIELTEDQKRKIEEAQARGEKFKVRLPDGSSERTLE